LCPYQIWGLKLPQISEWEFWAEIVIHKQTLKTSVQSG
jgi:hypothetical protein